MEEKSKERVFGDRRRSGRKKKQPHKLDIFFYFKLKKRFSRSLSFSVPLSKRDRNPAMVSVRPGLLLAAGFGVAPSTARHAEEPPLSRALQRAGSLAARTIREANRFVNASSSSSLPSASRAPALAALALVVLSVLSIAGK